MHRLYIQRRKLPKDTLFFGKGKKKFNLKVIYLYCFSHFTIFHSDDYYVSALKHAYLKHKRLLFVTVYLSHFLSKFWTQKSFRQKSYF